MPNIQTALRQEIARLARKEVRGEVDGLRSAARRFRQDIASLKQQISQLERMLKAALKSRGGDRRAAPPPETADTARRFSAERLARHRAKLGLSAARYGALVGVSGLSIYKWESGKVRPRSAQLEALAAVRGLSKRAAEERLAGQ